MNAPRHPGGPTDRCADGPPLEQRRLLPRPLGLPAGRRRCQRARAHDRRARQLRGLDLAWAWTLKSL